MVIPTSSEDNPSFLLQSGDSVGKFSQVDGTHPANCSFLFSPISLKFLLFLLLCNPLLLALEVVSLLLANPFPSDGLRFLLSNPCSVALASNTGLMSLSAYSTPSLELISCSLSLPLNLLLSELATVDEIFVPSNCLASIASPPMPCIPFSFFSYFRPVLYPPFRE